MSEPVSRPQTSTRDPAVLRTRLEAWLTERLPAGAEPQVSDLEIPTASGMSSETLLFDAMWTEDGKRRARSLVARVAPDPDAVPVFPVYDLDQQFRVIQLVGERSSAPVPTVYWSEPDEEALGAPFFVMKRIDGVVPPDIMPYNFGDNWLFDAAPADQRRLQDASVAVLAELHGIGQPEKTFALLRSDRPEPTALGRHVGAQWAYYEWVADGLRSPLIEDCFAWLQQHWPADEGPTVLSWGDARIGNMLFRDFEPVAVLDWEMAGLAPREVDVGWFIFLHRFFEDLAAQHGLGGMPHFLRRDDVATTYESLTGHAPRDLDWYTMYAAVRHGIVMARIARRSIRFGEAELPDDVDDMIMHRGTLEAMLAATYWK